MASIKISSKVEASTWNALREHARESDRSLSGVLTEAIADYLERRRVRPEVLRHLDESVSDHRELGRRLAE